MLVSSKVNKAAAYSHTFAWVSKYSYYLFCKALVTCALHLWDLPFILLLIKFLIQCFSNIHELWPPSKDTKHLLLVTGKYSTYRDTWVMLYYGKAT